LYIWPGTNPRLPSDIIGLGNRIGNAVLRKQIRLPSESIPADICLGVMIVGVNTLIVIGLFIVFA